MSIFSKLFNKNQDVVFYDSPGTGYEDLKKKVKLFEKVLAVESLLILVIIVLVTLAIVAIFVWNYPLGTTQNSSQITTLEASQFNAQRVVEVEASGASKEKLVEPNLYIKEQMLDLDTTFAAPTDNIKLTTTGKAKKEVVGFLPYWVLPRIDEINIDLLTAVSFFGLEVDANGDLIKNDSTGNLIDSWSTFQFNSEFDDFREQAKKKQVKIYLTLKCFNQTNIVKLVTSEGTRKNLINTAIYLMNSNRIDGINLDFEYIGSPSREVIDGFSNLVIDLNKEMKNQYPGSVLSVDTFVDGASKDRLQDVEVLADNVDSLMIMGYDFHTPNSSRAGPVAPLGGSDYSLFKFMNQYLEKVPAEKLILIVPYYGYDWPVSTVSMNAPTAGLKSDVRILSYSVIMDEARKTKLNWSEDSQTPWYSYFDNALNMNRVVHFDSVRSLSIKYDYILDKNLQGVGIWALGFDGKRNDLIQLLNDKFTK